MHRSLSVKRLWQTEDIWDGSCLEVFGVAVTGEHHQPTLSRPGNGERPRKALELVRMEGGDKVEPGDSD